MTKKHKPKQLARINQCWQMIIKYMEHARNLIEDDVKKKIDILYKKGNFPHD
jgi:hypothetical protein